MSQINLREFKNSCSALPDPVGSLVRDMPTTMDVATFVDELGLLEKLLKMGRLK